MTAFDSGAPDDCAPPRGPLRTILAEETNRMVRHFGCRPELARTAPET